MIYTDEAATYNGLPRSYEVVKHNSREYVHGQMDTNGIDYLRPSTMAARLAPYQRYYSSYCPQDDDGTSPCSSSSSTTRYWRHGSTPRPAG